jgi:hypothetical protein
VPGYNTYATFKAEDITLAQFILLKESHTPPTKLGVIAATNCDTALAGNVTS